jgi:hypothetical protein
LSKAKRNGRQSRDSYSLLLPAEVLASGSYELSEYTVPLPKPIARLGPTASELLIAD